jgi:hypothetical protein
MRALFSTTPIVKSMIPLLNPVKDHVPDALPQSSQPDPSEIFLGKNTHVPIIISNRQLEVITQRAQVTSHSF